MENTLENSRHSLAHILATVVKEKYPKVRLGIGPSIHNGFYYDFDFSGGEAPKQEELPVLEKRMRELLLGHIKFERKEVSRDEALKMFVEEPYKLELIEDFSGEGKTLTAYTSGTFTDLCKGGHVENTDAIASDAFTLSHIAGAYWRGSEKNKMLTRIYGLAFNTKAELDAYITEQEEAKKRDHKKLGKELDLFFFDDEVGRGLPMWTPKGTAVKFELEKFTRDLERTYGYEHVTTPYLGGEALYKRSGHLDHYSENMYAPIDMDGDLFYLRPMACPHHIKMFMRNPVSYREMPVRYAEIADYNRYEKSGELMGMIRLRKFQLTDAHIFVDPSNLKEEFKNICSLINAAMGGLGILEKVTYRFSKHDPNNTQKYYPDPKLWDVSEKTMKEALDEVGFKYTEAPDEAAFYGPKLDVQIKNVNGKEDTIITAQIDFLLPEKFDITFTDKEGKKVRPVMIHRSAIGALERTFAFLIEHYAGAFPSWLAPVQARILPVSEKHSAYAHEVLQTLKGSGIRAELDESNETLGKRIRAGKTEKIPYLLVVGDKEVEAKNITVENRDGEKVGAISVEQFTGRIVSERPKI